jgi:hypothetical protein
VLQDYSLNRPRRDIKATHALSFGSSDGTLDLVRPCPYIVMLKGRPVSRMCLVMMGLSCLQSRDAR